MEEEFLKKTKLILLAGSSGSGKTTISNALYEKYKVYPLVYYTTREQRNDDNSFFSYISLEKYWDMQDENFFIFSFGSRDKNRYGVSYSEFFEHINEGEDMILNVSYRDYFTIINKKIDNIVDVKLIVLTMNDLENNVRKRIINRGDSNKQDINNKIKHAIKEHEKYFEIISKCANEVIFTDELSIEDTISKINEVLDLSPKDNMILRRKI